MKKARRHVLATVVGLGLLAAMLGLVLLDGLISVEPPERVAVREVVFRDPPPPPPPPVTRQDQADDPRPDLSATRVQLPLELTTMDLNIKVSAGRPDTQGSGFGEGIGVGLGTVGLKDLDGIPSVIRAPIVDDYPEALLEQGIKSFEVMLHIMVDEQGRPHLIEVLDSAYPPYDARLGDFVSDVRFTPPTLLGVPVRTEYAWPVLIKLP